MEKLHGHWGALAYQIKEQSRCTITRKHRGYFGFHCTLKYVCIFTALNAGRRLRREEKIIAIDETQVESNNSRYESSASVLSRFLLRIYLFRVRLFDRVVDHAKKYSDGIKRRSSKE